MCGIAGFIRGAEPRPEPLANIARRMVDTMVHRGPNDAGAWAESEAGIALGHRRLSIVDLSPAGHQPMHSASGRFVIAFNGEIYNHLEIRAELEAAGETPKWGGHSDTETLLSAFERWGVERTLMRSVGMFAIALWDQRERILHLARDRFGEKPLYYGWAGAAFVFGSELKALRAHPAFSNPVCRHALTLYLRHMYVPMPRSIYQGIYKLEPGCLLSICGKAPIQAPAEPLSPPSSHGSLTIQRWWSLSQVVEAGASTPITGEGEALEALDAQLKETVKQQSRADVPLGALLSGGVDSSTVAAMMQQQTSRPVKTFTVGFEEAGFDESRHASSVAHHLGTDHTTLFVSAAEARAVIPQLPTMYDEPFADSSQIPTYLVCRAAREEVTVALSGDGGDELFGGYNRYLWGPRLWDQVSWLPYSVRQVVAASLQAAAPSTWNRLLGHAAVVQPGEKLHKFAAALRKAHDIDDLYCNLVSGWSCPEDLVQGYDYLEVPARLNRGAIKEERHGKHATRCEIFPRLPELPWAGTESAALRMMYRDTLTYLPDDILSKVDRASMAIGLETRIPFLDHRVVELAWRMPLSMKIRASEGKWALRQVLHQHVPRALVERPKAGFGIPVGQWLRGPMREWAEALLDEGRLLQEGYLNPAPIRATWVQHLSGRYDWTPRLWSVLMFQAWLEANA
jgi:asparagine synthase (glutamine-hydrolysing)